jgi:hypothetical protein
MDIGEDHRPKHFDSGSTNRRGKSSRISSTATVSRGDAPANPRRQPARNLIEMNNDNLFFNIAVTITVGALAIVLWLFHQLG